jgi:hypothetical protein
MSTILDLSPVPPSMDMNISDGGDFCGVDHAQDIPGKL